jgi:hypothetical protein
MNFLSYALGSSVNFQNSEISVGCDRCNEKAPMRSLFFLHTLAQGVHHVYSLQQGSK